jgi:acyl-CoA synthetase (AMP-forming)/AMP-acid ligase II
MRNVPEWPVAFWAGVLAGAIVTPLNAWWTAWLAAAYHLRRIEPRA